MFPAARIQGFRGEYLWELDIIDRQLPAIAETIPEDKYDWRPSDRARSISEVLVHIAAGTFMLLEVAGTPAPVDFYPDIASARE